jgi:hypothetical protein
MFKGTKPEVGTAWPICEEAAMTEIKKLTDEFRRDVRATATLAVERKQTDGPTDAAKVRIVRARLDEERLGVQAKMERSFGGFAGIDEQASPTEDQGARSSGPRDPL